MSINAKSINAKSINASKLRLLLAGGLCLYLLSYAAARLIIFQTVEHYAGSEGKSKPRQDYITKVDRPPGDGWEYLIFLPVIKMEEGIVNFYHNW